MHAMHTFVRGSQNGGGGRGEGLFLDERRVGRGSVWPREPYGNCCTVHALSCSPSARNAMKRPD